MKCLAVFLASVVLLTAGCQERSVPLTATANRSDTEVTPQPIQDANAMEALAETASALSSENAWRIDPGASVESALTMLDRLGYTKESVWQWGSPHPDARYVCRSIAKGVFIVLYYSEESKLMTGLAMMFVPPDYTHRGNYQVISVDSVTFSEEGAYTVEFPKPTSASSK